MTGKADAVRAVSQQFKDRTNTVIEGVMAHLRDDNAKEILGPGLSPLIGRGSLKSIVTFALYADVLRMVRDMVMADGEISDEEVQESLGLLSVLAAGFAKVRKEYASFASLNLMNARDFLSQYSKDAGLFGYANEETKWAGVQVCRNVDKVCQDTGPADVFRSSLTAWAEAIAASDAVTADEQRMLHFLMQDIAPLTRAVAPPRDDQAKPQDALQSECEEYEAWRLKGQDSCGWLLARAERFADWLRMANTGDPRAQFFAAKCYDCGVGAPENKTEAARLFLAAADQGHALAMFNLAVCHDNGEGVPEDKSEAVRWYRAAADCGLVDAVFNLGICYSLGEGVAEDSAEAFRLYRAAADAGHAGALYNLGVCYANGFGVEADESEAIRCYRAAADLGDADAIARLQLYGRDAEGGSVDTPENRTLTEEIASQFVANNEAVDLSAFTAIEDNAAALLANYRFEVFGAYLSLDGLKSLSAFSAAALASHDGDLSLCGLDTLSPEIAATLAKHTHRLQLGGLASLSDEAAEALALHRPTSVRFRLQTRPTLSVGGYNGECELTPRGLRALAMYSGCIELSCDFNDKSEDSEWAEPLRIFHARQDQRLFKSFSSRILELLERKEASGLQELADWTFSEAYGKSPWEVFDEFKDLMSACGNRTVWLHVFDEDDEPKPFYLFVGDEDALVRRIETLPDKT